MRLRIPGPGTVDEVGHGRHLQRRADDEDADSEGDNRTDFQEGRDSRAESATAIPAIPMLRNRKS